MLRWNRIVVAIAVAFASVAGVAASDQPEESTSIGFSLVANSGNSESSSFGLTFDLVHGFDPFLLKVSALALRATTGGQSTAERFAAAARGERPITDDWTAFAGASAERDRFAGYDLRGVVEAGASLKYLTGPEQTLAFDAGLTWTREDLREGSSRDFLGALIGATYSYQFTETSSFGERLVLYPNFDQSSDWRATSETSLQATLSTATALKLTVFFRYDHVPVPGYEKTDTTTMASVVVKL